MRLSLLVSAVVEPESKTGASLTDRTWKEAEREMSSAVVPSEME